MNLSGHSILDLDSAHQLVENDLFIVSEPVGKPQQHQWFSKNIDICVLSSQIVSDIESALSLGSMASQSIDDYSAARHSHGDLYNKVKINSTYNEDADSVYVGSFVVDDKLTKIYAPFPVVSMRLQPEIGQLKFIHQLKKKKIDVYSSDFDGWVYADGSGYPLQKFNVHDEFEINGMTFYVPALNNFIRLNPTPYLKNDMTETYRHVDPQHHHNARLNLTGKVKGTLTYSCSTVGAGNTSHGATETAGKFDFKFDLDCTGLNVDPASTNYIRQSGQVGSETYPSYVNMPVMIYIGKPKH